MSAPTFVLNINSVVEALDKHTGDRGTKGNFKARTASLMNAKELESVFNAIESHADAKQLFSKRHCSQTKSFRIISICLIVIGVVAAMKIIYYQLTKQTDETLGHSWHIVGGISTTIGCAMQVQSCTHVETTSENQTRNGQVLDRFRRIVEYAKMQSSDSRFNLEQWETNFGNSGRAV